MIENTPTRLAMKLGVSLASTMPLPRESRAKSHTSSRIAGSVSAVGMTSNSFMYRGGLKKWVPRKRGRRSSGNAAAMACRESPDVLLARMASEPRWGTTAANTLCLMARSSLTASMTQSASAKRGRSSSRLPVSMSRILSLLNSGDGLVLSSACTESWANRLRTVRSSRLLPAAFSAGVSSPGTMSRTREGIPALAK